MKRVNVDVGDEEPEEYRVIRENLEYFHLVFGAPVSPLDEEAIRLGEDMAEWLRAWGINDFFFTVYQ